MSYLLEKLYQTMITYQSFDDFKNLITHYIYSLRDQIYETD